MSWTDRDEHVIKRYSTYDRIPNNIQELNHIRSSRQILQNLDFTLNLLLLDRLERLDDTFLSIRYVYALEYF